MPREVRAREAALERRVSDVTGKCRCFGLGIDDRPGPESLRGYIKRNAIALLKSLWADRDQPAV